MQQQVSADKTTMAAAHRWADGLHAVTARMGPRVLRTEPRPRGRLHPGVLESPGPEKRPAARSTRRG
jgi:hypothetical protein